MKATFHIAGDLDVEVLKPQTEAGVLLKIIQGAYFGEGEDKRQISDVWLTKGTARAIASAIMACAAEA